MNVDLDELVLLCSVEPVRQLGSDVENFGGVEVELQVRQQLADAPVVDGGVGHGRGRAAAVGCHGRRRFWEREGLAGADGKKTGEGGKAVVVSGQQSTARNGDKTRQERCTVLHLILNFIPEESLNYGPQNPHWIPFRRDTGFG